MMEGPVESIKEKKEYQNKGYSFTQIKVYSEFKYRMGKMEHKTDVSVKNINTPKKIQSRVKE